MTALKQLLFVAIVIASAEAQGDVIDGGQRIVGTWSAQKEDVVNRVTYLGDGTFRGHLMNASTGMVFWSYEGKWIFQGDLLRYSYTKSDSARVEVGSRGQDEVIEIDADHFKIRTSTAEERTYTRVRR